MMWLQPDDTNYECFVKLQLNNAINERILTSLLPELIYLQRKFHVIVFRDIYGIMETNTLLDPRESC